MYDEVPANYDSRTPEMNLKLAGMIDVMIGTEAGEGGMMKGVPPERIAARGKPDPRLEPGGNGHGDGRQQ